MTVLAKDERWTSDEIVFDPETRAEKSFFWLAVLCAAILLVQSTAQASTIDDWSPLRFTFLLMVPFVLAYALRSNFHERYLVRFKSSEVLLSRRIFGVESLHRVALFRDLAAVVIQPKRNYHRHAPPWQYGLALVRKNGSLITVISPQDPSYEHEHRSFRAELELEELQDRDYDPLNEAFLVTQVGHLLAERLGLPFHHVAAKKVLKIEKTPTGCNISYSVPVSDLPVGGRLACAFLLLVLLFPFLLIGLVLALDHWR